MFATLGDARRDGALRDVIDDIPSLKIVYEQSYLDRKAENPLISKELYYDFMPPPKDSIHLSPLVPSSLPSRITACHCWSFILADKRRKNLVNSNNIATGVFCKCHMIDPNSRCTAEATCHPKIQQKKPAAVVDRRASKHFLKLVENIKLKYDTLKSFGTIWKILNGSGKNKI